MTLIEALEKRFGANRIEYCAPINEGDIPLMLIELEVKGKVTVLSTCGLSDYKMPVDEIFAGREYNEIYFCLPSYWDLNDLENPEINWVFDWIQRLAKFPIEKKTWFGHGHTIPAGNPPLSLSKTMKQNYFMFCDPILLDEELTPVELGDKTVNFLSIIPIFEKEWLYKSGGNTRSFLKKFNAKRQTEQLDDFRGSVLERKFFKWIP
ncbi:MAG: suppressor of fused domain protein [Crocinitomicaceae bacterium]